ncbi:MAG TPA: hypothetical protein DCY23_03580 [Ruminococcaceae bacterium]|nr:hypothetical protein [Oscillospiraceae bacterium]HCD80821.1 hypothetical protein [Oscillospiraceae bacterium]
MSVYDYLLLLIIAVWVVFAVIYIIKSRKGSGCSACCRNCSCRKKPPFCHKAF